MPTFLHVADVHLGFDRYDSPERSKDFFYAFRDVLQRYALDRQVDFVLIAGDLFEYRSILPNVLNQAEIALNLVKQAGIPVLAIEGNHDNRPYGVNTSWLRYLSDHDFLKLLEPTPGESSVELQPWSEGSKRGGYIDLPCGVRVIGSTWYGSTAPQGIQELAAAIQRLPSGPDHTVLMFHHGLEGQIARYQGALRYAELLPLRDAGVEYLALGHIHKNYAVEGWVFNPGSLEANSIGESEFDRGAYVVEITSGQIQAQLMQDYQQRSCYRLRWEAKGKETPQEITQLILQEVKKKSIPSAEEAIVEFKLTGQVGFQRHELDQRQIESQIQAITAALIVLFRFEATSLDLDTTSTASGDTERIAIEEKIYADILAGHAHYKRRSTELAKTLMAMKEMVLDERPDPELYAYLSQMVLGSPMPEDL
jgi:DNA repair exonuclease SbcCD nuclease subunit